MNCLWGMEERGRAGGAENRECEDIRQGSAWVLCEKQDNSDFGS